MEVHIAGKRFVDFQYSVELLLWTHVIETGATRR